MTKVLLQYGSPAPDGTYPPVEGVLIWTPTRRRVVAGMPDKIIMPIGFKVPITGGVITVNVAPSGIDWVWRVDELVKGMSRVISYKAVPDQEEIDFTELVSVNPLSLSPLAEPEPIWYPWAEALAETTARAEQSAEDSKLAAIDSQDSALASKNSAAGSATEAYNYMQAAGGHANYAGTSAFSAGTSAATALGHKNDAEAAEFGAQAAESNAILYRDQANIARTAAETAQLGSEAARNDAVNAKLGAEDAMVAAQQLTDVTVTTGLVDENGHLILSRTDTTEVDAGYVIGPPINLSIVGTTTSPSSEVVVGPQGPIGPKGDPGGWLASTVIAIGASLDTITTSGLYLNPSSNWAMGPANATTGGHLEVISSSGYVYQRYVNINEQRKVFTRTRNSAGTWTAWRGANTVRVDQTAGRAIYMWDDVNSRDQLIWGDTGWRSIANDPSYGVVAAGNYFGMPNGATIADGMLKIRRVGSTVWLTSNGPIQPKQDYSTTTRNVCILPPGFRTAAESAHLICRYGNNGGDPNQRLVFVGPGANWTNPAYLSATPLIDSNWNNFAANSGWPKQYGGIWLFGSWETTDAWPTTLPGTASGSIPNT
ncbi:minor tail protein [Arthrobacter phage Argan]|nr:minor tail protein [Arthrobacter phage GantcherGoblin]WNT45401.1 minor tail protein [Arthrobacter phage Argan]